MRKTAYNKLKKELLRSDAAFIDRKHDNVLLATPHFIVSIPYDDYETYVMDDDFPALNEIDFAERVNIPNFCKPFVHTDIRQHYERMMHEVSYDNFDLIKFNGTYKGHEWGKKRTLFDAPHDQVLINARYHDAVKSIMGKDFSYVGKGRRQPVVMHDGWCRVAFILPIICHSITDHIDVDRKVA